MSKEFICGGCKKTFTKARPEEEALKEMRANFGDLPPEQRVPLCDGCFNNFMLWLAKTETVI